MACASYASDLEAVKGSFYYPYISASAFSDILLQKAIDEVSCTPEGLLISANCPTIYRNWLALSVINLIIDRVAAETDPGEYTLNTPPEQTGAVDPVLYLKKKKVFDEECEWAEVKQCLDCDQTKVQTDTQKWMDMCQGSLSPYGTSTFFGRPSAAACSRFSKTRRNRY